MKNFLTIHLTGIMLFACSFHINAITIVKDGQSKSVIVLAKTPTRSAQLAARELQEHIKKISGAKVPIITETKIISADAVPIYVGESKKTREIELRSNDFAPQESMIKITDKYIVLIGRDDPDFGSITYDENGAFPEFWNTWRPFYRFGTLNAVYTFLEKKCAVRWYMVTDLGTVTPEKHTIDLEPAELRFQPWAKYRMDTWRGAWQLPGEYPTHEGEIINGVSTRDANLFLLRSRIGGEAICYNLTLGFYNKKYGKKHPEWFVDNLSGKHVRLKYNHPELINQLAKDAEQFFSRGYRERKGNASLPMLPNFGVGGIGDYFSITPSKSHIYDKDCYPELQKSRHQRQNHKGGGLASNYVYQWVNTVAQKIYERYPEMWIATYAYAENFEPPDFKINPNVAVVVDMADGRDGYGLDILRQWGKKVNQLFTYEFRFDRDKFPTIDPHDIAQYMKTAKSIGVDGMYIDMSTYWGKAHVLNPSMYHLNHYITFRMLREKDVDVDELLDEYYRLFYGNAFKSMSLFWKALEDTTRSCKIQKARNIAKHTPVAEWKFVDNLKLLDRLEKHLNSALKAEIREPYVSRIKIIKQGVVGYLKNRIKFYRDKK